VFTAAVHLNAAVLPVANAYAYDEFVTLAQGEWKVALHQQGTTGWQNLGLPCPTAMK
jgi:hypothetical protein